MSLHMSFYSNVHQNIIFFALLAVLVGQIYVLIIPANSNFAPSAVLSLAIVIFIKVTSA
jgi:hypothetical protein